LDSPFRIPDLDGVRVDHHVHLMTDQSAGNGIGVAFDLDRAAGSDLDAPAPLAMFEAGDGKIA
jgi:hypothetical protein